MTDVQDTDQVIEHEGTMSNGREIYACSTCGGHFAVAPTTETPTQCPWGDLHD